MIDDRIWLYVIGMNVFYMKKKINNFVLIDFF